MSFKRMILLCVLVFGLGLTASIASAQAEDTYIVQPGDTLQSIARKYNSSVDAIAARNGIINTSSIRTGQVLIIPRAGSNVNATVQTYTVQRGDNLRDIALRYSTTIDAIVDVNNITASSYIYPGQELTLPSSGVVAPGQPAASPTTHVDVVRRVVNGYYRVQYGDTLLEIAQDFGIDAWSIARANGIYNLNRIFAGQLLRIPGY